MNLIADEQILYHSPDPKGLYCYTPWICHGFGGRLFVSYDLAGSKLSLLDGPKSDHGDYGSNQCQILYSDDHGKTWTCCSKQPMLHARVFTAGNSLYILGHSGRMVIARSDDNGLSWSQPYVLDENLYWHQSGGSIDYRHGKIYLTMEVKPFSDRWAGGDPLLMSANVNADLTKRESWTFSNLVKFEDAGAFQNTSPIWFSANCWLESSVLRVYDPKNSFYDPEDMTVLVLLRVDGTEHYGALLIGKENADGSLTLAPWQRQDGTKAVFFPFPGGHMKFHIVYDEQDRFYWMTASVVEFSTTQQVVGPKERRVLGLYASRNLFDWHLTGIVSAGETRLCSRHYSSLVIDGDDILVASRSGDLDAKNTHDTDMITLHRVRNFRSLAIPMVD